MDYKRAYYNYVHKPCMPFDRSSIKEITSYQQSIASKSTNNSVGNKKQKTITDYFSATIPKINQNQVLDNSIFRSIKHKQSTI